MTKTVPEPRPLPASAAAFFREPETFAALKSEIYPRLVKHLAPGAQIRIWVPGCSTGEEVYSHAINLIEYLGRHAPLVRFLIFATDGSPALVARARAGRYTSKETAGVSPERLRRFFAAENGGYRVLPAVRERCIFATQNLAKDPPFTNLDVISGRNLPFSMGPALQKTAMQIFQFALKPRGLAAA